MRSSTYISTAATVMAATAAGAYVWPDKHDFVEDVLSLQAGAIRQGFLDGVNPCSFGTGIRGVQNAAEWLRTAYHDMATAEVAAGTGGIDASIRYETARSENEGAAFNHTFAFFSNYYNTHVPLSDLIALGVVTAVAQCGGPVVEFRAGRIDATEGGALGVPKPDQDIESTTAAFARQGFTQSEMVALVACGHTLGGVHHEDFPQIVGDPDATIGNVTQFEGNDSATSFDNHVVTEYLDGTTQNPLVVSSNNTFNSDKRVFESDGNVTMKALADPAVFQATCANMLSRMINTVPKDVVLSEPISPYDIKPYITTFALTADNTISLAGRIRVRLDADASRKKDDMQIDLVYTARDGTETVTKVIPTDLLTFIGGVTFGLHGASFVWFTFSVTDINAASGISGFQVRMTKPSTGAVTTFDNAGTGSYPLDDSLLYLDTNSCLTASSDNKKHSLTVVAAVRTDRAAEPVTVDLNYKASRPDVSKAPFLSTQSAVLIATPKTLGAYTIFKTTVDMDEEFWFTAELDLFLGSNKKTKVLKKSASDLLGTCADL